MDLLDITYDINSSLWLYTNLSSQQYFYKDFFWQTAIIAVFVIKCNVFSRAIHIHKDSKEKNETFSFWNYHKFADSEIFFNFPLSLMVWFLLLIKRKSNWLTTLFCLYIHNYTYRLRNIFHSGRIKDVMRDFFLVINWTLFITDHLSPNLQASSSLVRLRSFDWHAVVF